MMVSGLNLKHIVTCADPWSELFELLHDSSKGEHLVTIAQHNAKDPHITREYKVAAYHIQLDDWLVIKTAANRVVAEGFNDEGEEYTFYSYLEHPDIVSLPQCETPEWLSSQTTVAGNYIDNNADVDGTKAGCKAERNYYFWLEVSQKYAVVQVRYFVIASRNSGGGNS